MPAPKILILSILVSPILSAHLGRASLWNQPVFPDDEHWLSLLAKISEDSDGKSNDVGNYEVCQTPECRSVADEFRSSLNKSVDPCDNFYDFTCSGWSTDSPIPPSLPAWSRFLMFQTTVNHRIKGILETEPEPSDILPVRQAKKWYRTCMDTETLEQRGIKPIESILLRAGGWPISMDEEEWDATEYTWQEVERNYVRLTGALTFFNIEAYPPSDDEKYGTIKIEPQKLPLSEHMPIKYRNYSGNDYELYVSFVAGVADMFIEGHHADVPVEKLRKDAMEIVEFEKKIYELQKDEHFEMPDLEEFIEFYETNVMNSSENSAGKIDWQSLIHDLFDIVNIEVDPYTDLYLPSMGYITGIGELLEKTPTRTIVNYIHWHFVANMLTYTTEAARDHLYQLLMGEYGIKERPPRWSECINEMKMAHAAAYAFVNKHITKETESAVLKMSKNIQIEMKKQIDGSAWLDEKSKILAKDKLNGMKIFVGFPDWYKNKKSVLKSYKGLTIGSEYFDNTLSYMRYERKMALKKLSPPSEVVDTWFMDPITVNAIYGEDENVLNLPAADFQAPLFTPQIPDNVNYGIVGVIVGHEIGHGFDDTGIMHGTDGRSTKLSQSILKNYYQRADCFTDQFDVYYEETKAPETTGSTSEPTYHKERKSEYTRSENIADSTGMQAVFEAYRKLKKPKGSVRLAGLEEFTDDQLFFLSFAAMWCETETPQFAKKKKEAKDTHSPARIRVVAALSNTKGFAEAFNCPVGSPMNPADKCSIWGKSDSPRNTPSLWKREKPNRWEGKWKI